MYVYVILLIYFISVLLCILLLKFMDEGLVRKWNMVLVWLRVVGMGDGWDIVLVLGDRGVVIGYYMLYCGNVLW